MAEHTPGPWGWDFDVLVSNADGITPNEGIVLWATKDAYGDLGIEASDIGAQAGEMAKKIFSGKDANNIARVHARKMVVSTNLMIAGKFRQRYQLG